MPEKTDESLQIKTLLDDGFNLIEVREDKKTPFREWAQYQNKKITLTELWSFMDHYKTTAVAAICGKISDNLIGIDIDTKHEPGIDAFIFKDLQTLYPLIYNSLRIDRTPSGGYHLLFRVSGNKLPPSCDAAAREATEVELLVKPKVKRYPFIEIKSNGRLLQMPPSPGYTVHNNNPIPVISYEDACSIVNLMKSYTRIILQPVQYKPTKQDNDYYDENPFEHFNGSDAGADILTNEGWKNTRGGGGNFIYFTKPDSKTNDVHASYNTRTHIYRIFSSSTEFDPDKMYNPATVLSILNHKSDKRETFRYLVDKGFGKIKYNKEQSIIKKAAISNKPLPANISDAGIKMHAVISAKLKQVHPFGIFWEQDEKSNIIINREKFYTVCDGLGFKLYNEISIAQIKDNIIYERTQRQFIDTIKAYVNEEDESAYNDICNSYEGFIERHGKFTISRLQLLDEGIVMSDTKTDCYKFYTNGMLHINKDGFTLIDNPTDKVIWHHKIQQREFNEQDEGLYVDFLNKAIGVTDYLLICIGYLSHEFKDDTAGKIIVLSEECENPKDGGGSGKNIFSSLFNRNTSFFTCAGSQVKYDNDFLQAWNYEKIYCVSDALKNFNFEFVKNFTDNNATVKKLYFNQLSIPHEKMPKFIVSTNYSFDNTPGPIKRRLRPIEFTNFFTKSGGVNTHYNGVHFPNGWAINDWNNYDTTIALSIQLWLKNNREIPEPLLTDGGWKKQFEQIHGRTINAIIKEYWTEWVSDTFVSNEEFKRNCDAYYNENNVAQKYKPSSFSFNTALAEYSDKMNIIFNKDATQSIQNSTVRGRSFNTKN